MLKTIQRRKFDPKEDFYVAIYFMLKKISVSNKVVDERGEEFLMCLTLEAENFA